MNLIITGRPRSGKSTLLINLVEDIPNKQGFFTREILENGERVGFEMVSSTGTKAILAHIKSRSPVRVSKYGVEIDSLNNFISSLPPPKKGDLLYIDEIGQMELFSDKFKELVEEYLNAKNTFIGTLSSIYQDDFTDSAIKRRDVYTIEISAKNRQERENFARQLIKKVDKAKGYAAQSDRFFRHGNQVELKSEHGTRMLITDGESWACNCDFFSSYKICSHTIAAQALYGD